MSLRRRGCSRIIPAYAGSTSPSLVHISPIPDHPRIRGEHPDEDAFAVFHYGSSPHTRGAPQEGDEALPGERIIPAYAGSTGRLGGSASA